MADKSPATQPPTAVVYLLRRGNDPVHLKRFVHSYRTCADILPHQLIILCKGFQAAENIPGLDCLDGLEFTSIPIPDTGFDIGPYMDVARAQKHQYFCFLNSFSEILSPDWLTKLHTVIKTKTDAGIVGATGSWETTADNMQFPNYHMRTNAFLISSALLNDLEIWPMVEKHHASLFEAGPQSLTRQILARGLQPYVVDRFGKAWAKEDWHRANTYRAAGQEGLLVSDNRTNAYQMADPATRDYLATLAWSDKHPGPDPAKRNKLSRRLRRWLGISKK